MTRGATVGGPALLEPIGQSLQVGGEGAEVADVSWRRLRRHAGKVFPQADVEAGGMGIDRCPALINGYFFLFFWDFEALLFIVVWWWFRPKSGMKNCNLSNRITPRAG